MAVSPALAEPVPSAGAAAYRDTLRPLFAERCYSCHGALKQEAGLRLDTVASMERGGDSGPVLVKGSPSTSLIRERVSAADPATRMPPAGEGEPLTETQLGLLEEWIMAGAPAPPGEQPEADPRRHWAFQPRMRPEVPAKPPSGWGRNPIDAFVALGHATHGVAPQPEAPRHVLVRRLYLDLIGLPPSAEELAALEADASPDWYDTLVERLLADPRYGERWARHWMDVWRYSDWWGLGADHRNSQKHMWHWRDWIIESVNADVPYAEMLRQMLAADELYPDDQQKLRATGYLGRNWFKYQRTQWLEETVEHIGKGMLGLTLNCSKCHDHKYDPLPQEDFYRMRAFLEPYHMRLDMVAGETDYEKNGIPRAFDALLEAPTYLFERGDEKKPDTSRPLAPAVPAIVAWGELSIEPVSLPKSAWQTVRRPGVLETLVAKAARDAQPAADALAAALAKRKAAEGQVAVVEAGAAGPVPVAEPAPVARAAAPAGGAVVDEFAILDPNRWSAAGGSWKHEPGRAIQDLDGDVWAGLRLSVPQPRDFDVTVQFTLEGGRTYRSVGIAFDSIGAVDPGVPGDADDGAVMVYLSGFQAGPKVQGAFRSGGPWQYPTAAAAPAVIERGRKHTLRVAARDTLVNAWLDDRLVLAWRLPFPRRDGALQLVAYDAVVAFQRFSLSPLGGDVALDAPGKAPANGVVAPVTKEAALAAAIREAAAAERALAVALAVKASVERRAEAMQADWAAEAVAAGDATAEPLHAAARERARAAARAEKEVMLAQAKQRLGAAEAAVALAATDKKEAAERELAAARTAVAEAEQAVAAPGESFTPLAVGTKWVTTTFIVPDKADPEPPMPPTSSGRRSALAAWITDPRNPLTARVAANHIWMRHMGRPLVTTVFDFGRKGTPPDHPLLLEWLACELVDGPAGGPAWSMKHLHRRIVTSAAYRMSSSTAGAAANLKADADNRWLWRREPVRLESQVIRDCVLAIAGTLDPTMGGPSIPAGQQAASTRRSLYFFHSSVDRNAFLSAFDEADVQDCYRRDQSIVPQQALALSNAGLVHDSAGRIAARIEGAARSGPGGGGPASDDEFLGRAFALVLGRTPTVEEKSACLESLGAWRTQAAATPNAGGEPHRLLVWALLNHNDFLTVR